LIFNGSLVGGLFPGVDDFVRALVEGLRQREGSRARLAVLLTTDGGDVETVQRIVDVFRHHYDQVSFVIPNYAFSAGTILALSGDDIFMDYYSRLGPIDPQVKNSRGRWVPALGYLKQWQRLMEKATAGTLNTAEYQLMISGFDQAELYEYEQARELSVTLLTEWLVKYKFKNWDVTQDRQERVTPEMKQSRAESIARELNDTDKWHSHGHGISMAILRDDPNLKLLIEDLNGNPERSEIVKQYYGLLEDYMQRRGQTGALHAVGRHVPFEVGS